VQLPNAGGELRAKRASVLAVSSSALLGADDFVEALDDAGYVLGCGTGQSFPNAFYGQRPNLTDFHP
jgi:hypothetical protein